MKKKHLFLLSLTLPFFVSCLEAAKVSGSSDDDEDTAKTSSLANTSQEGTGSSAKLSSSSKKISSSSSEEEYSSYEEYSSPKVSSARSPSSMRSSSSTKASSSAGTSTLGNQLLIGSERIDTWDQADQRILSTPLYFTCYGTEYPEQNTPQVWTYWIEGSRLYTQTFDQTECSYENCTEMQGTSSLKYDYDDIWSGGTSLLDTWKGSTDQAIVLSQNKIDLYVNAGIFSSITDLLGAENAIGPGSSAQLISPTIIEVPYQGHTIRFSLDVDTANGILRSYHITISEDNLDCGMGFYFYQSNAPDFCPSDSYADQETCTSQFQTNAIEMQFCDISYIGDGSCDANCLNFDDAQDCSDPFLAKRSVRKPKPIRELLKSTIP